MYNVIVFQATTLLCLSQLTLPSPSTEMKFSVLMTLQKKSIIKVCIDV